jgi:hypothetical protein
MLTSGQVSLFMIIAYGIYYCAKMGYNYYQSQKKQAELYNSIDYILKFATVVYLGYLHKTTHNAGFKQQHLDKMVDFLQKGYKPLSKNAETEMITSVLALYNIYVISALGLTNPMPYVEPAPYVMPASFNYNASGAPKFTNMPMSKSDVVDEMDAPTESTGHDFSFKMDGEILNKLKKAGYIDSDLESDDESVESSKEVKSK